jgi:hypothetical protein
LTTIGTPDFAALTGVGLTGAMALPAAVDILNRIAALALPEVARDWRESRWDRFTAGEDEIALLGGDAPLYTDINPGSLHIGDRATWAVDWAWPTCRRWRAAAQHWAHHRGIATPA